jgi:hypothetical protein
MHKAPVSNLELAYRDILNANLPQLRTLKVESELTVLGIFSESDAAALAESLEHRLAGTKVRRNGIQL